MFIEECLLKLFGRIALLSHYYSQCCLMINNSIFSIKFKVIPAVKASISKYIFETQCLRRSTLDYLNRFLIICIFKLLRIFGPRFFYRSELIADNFLDLELIILHSMLNSPFDPIHVWIAFIEMSIDFLSNIRVD